MSSTSKPASDDRIAALCDGFGWPDRLHRRAIELAEATPDRRAWVQFLSRSSLALGTVLVLAGVMDLVAFNWEDLGRFSRILLVAGVFVSAGVAAIIRGTEDLPGRLAATSAAFLIGPLIGVIGQTYQTGADAWQLFAWWTVLCLPFLAATRWIPLLMMWTVLVDITLCTLHFQTWPGEVESGFAYTASALVLVHAAIVGACERLELDRWFRRAQGARLERGSVRGVSRSPRWPRCAGGPARCRSSAARRAAESLVAQKPNPTVIAMNGRTLEPPPMTTGAAGT